jgi:hypothetical protein
MISRSDSMTQTCRICGELKPIELFDVRADTGKARTECKSCRRARQRVAITLSLRRTAYVVDADQLLKCSRCGVLKHWTEFPRRGRGSRLLHTWCKPCFSEYKAARHQKNHDREMQRIRRNHDARVASNRATVKAYLAMHPCIDCGETDVVVLEFDHVRGDKVAEVSLMIALGYSWSKIELEIAKCEVRCANDHRRVTKERIARSRGTAEEATPYLFGDPGAIRTPDQHLRRVLL